MTQEEKELLLKDLSARLPYGVICLVEFSDDRKYAAKLTSVSVTSLGFGSSGVAYLHCCKPYLRPMESMTNDERKEYVKECNKVLLMRYRAENHYPVTDWLLSHHFDYRGLIEKGLALEASNDMYKEE